MSAERPKVKICGVTNPGDALLAVRLGADYLGLNFYPPSPRALDIPTAIRIAEAVRGGERPVPLVGVFVNRPPQEVETIDRAVGLDLLQFHGDESPEAMAPYAHRALAVLRVEEQLDPAVFAGLEDFWGVLVDTRHPGLYGGSGTSWDFTSLRSAGDATIPPRLFIAGGLRPANVHQALETARPWGIDLCSGVEKAPGQKDPQLLEHLFEEIHHGQSPPAS